jgi:hypothetical protein
MSRSNKYDCDFCDAKDVEKYRIYFRTGWTFGLPTEEMTHEIKDICPECMRKMLQWIASNSTFEENSEILHSKAEWRKIR